MPESVRWLARSVFEAVGTSGARKWERLDPAEQQQWEILARGFLLVLPAYQRYVGELASVLPDSRKCPECGSTKVATLKYSDGSLTECCEACDHEWDGIPAGPTPEETERP